MAIKLPPTEPVFNNFFTIPNIMGYFRILLLPFIAAAILRDWYWTKVILLAVSALTDFLDGRIARKLNQVTELGKMLDPIADKLTLCVLFVCLGAKNSYAGIIAIAMITKEFYMGVMELCLLYKAGHTTGGALWFGKLCTAALFLSLGIFLLVPDISWQISAVITIFSCSIMVYTAAMYGVTFYMEYKKGRNQ